MISLRAGLFGEINKIEIIINSLLNSLIFYDTMQFGLFTDRNNTLNFYLIIK